MSAKSSITFSSKPEASCRIPKKSELDQFFSGINNRIKASHPTANKFEMGHFFTAIIQKIEQAAIRQSEIDEKQASKFNIFDLIEPDENKLSDILAGLLDPNGAHGQSGLFLRLFFKQLGLEFKQTNYASVKREALTHEILNYRRRIDILIEADVLVAIENKVDSSEQKDQVKDYLYHLENYTRRHTFQFKFIYLTPDGRPPISLQPPILKKYKASERLYCWSYGRELHEWLKDCYGECKAQKIKNFLSDFIFYIESVMKRDFMYNEEADDYEE